MSRPGLLCVMGSGETAPTMTAVHAELIGRVGGEAARAVLLDTPYGFQENADDITARAQAYFHTSVQHDIEVARLRDREIAGARECEMAHELIRRAEYVFAGPGSPSYAVRQWLGSPVPVLLAEVARRGGCVTFSSAAATTVGMVALPVYEVYKVGEAPLWREGLDLLGALTSIRAAVVPHWNNAEGGNHDTRFCYMGERRLRLLEDMLPDGAGILGVDEHTAAIIDVPDRSLTVRGRGGVVWRGRDGETVVPTGATVFLDDLVAGAGLLRSAAEERAGARGEMAPSVPGPSNRAAPGTPGTASPIAEDVAARRHAFEASVARGDVDTALEAVLGLDTDLAAWVHDNPGTDELDRARSDLRGMVVRLGDLARTGIRDPREAVAPYVELALELRATARADGRFADSDTIRGRLTALGVEVRDTADGAQWELRGVAASPAGNRR